MTLALIVRSDDRPSSQGPLGHLPAGGFLFAPSLGTFHTQVLTDLRTSRTCRRNTTMADAAPPIHTNIIKPDSYTERVSQAERNDRIAAIDYACKVCIGAPDQAKQLAAEFLSFIKTGEFTQTERPVANYYVGQASAVKYNAGFGGASEWSSAAVAVNTEPTEQR